jgi:putative protease
MEEKRPGEFMPVFEDDRGTYFFNSKDLCMIDNIPEAVETGVKGFKIEGRMKSVHYVASVVRAYRNAIDAYFADPQNFKLDKKWLEEIGKASHREFTTGFYFGKPTGEEQIYKHSSYIREYDFVGVVREFYPDSKLAVVEQRNNFRVGQEIEFMNPSGKDFHQKIEKMWDQEGNEITVAPHPQQIVKIPVKREIEPYTILRRKRHKKS